MPATGEGVVGGIVLHYAFGLEPGAAYEVHSGGVRVGLLLAGWAGDLTFRSIAVSPTVISRR